MKRMIVLFSILLVAFNAGCVLKTPNPRTLTECDLICIDMSYEGGKWNSERESSNYPAVCSCYGVLK